MKKKYTQVKTITLIGMSGIGKSHIAKMLKTQDKWFHYSCDYRIGSYYLNEDILNNIKKIMVKNELLKKLLVTNSIYIKNNISFDNLLPISSYLGKIGNPEFGGISLAEFKNRQQFHYRSEISACYDMQYFLKKSKQEYGYDKFINDTSGSLCELDDNNLYETISKQSLIIYIKADKNNEKQLIERSIKSPKPLYYNPKFFKDQLDIYIKEKNINYVADIIPDEFIKWIFPNFFYNRIPKYEKIANKYGITIMYNDLSECKSHSDFLDLVQKFI